MTKTTRTQVSKANTGIKAILAAVGLEDWKGRRVTVIEAAEGWAHTQYVDDPDRIFVVCLDDMSAGRAPAPVYGQVASVTHIAHEGTALVIYSRAYGCEGVEIVIPAGDLYRGAYDRLALEVLVDALIARKPAKVRAELVAQTSAHVGMQGIACALAEVRAKADSKKQAPSQEAA